jgi:hypothetical protein
MDDLLHELILIWCLVVGVPALVGLIWGVLSIVTALRGLRAEPRPRDLPPGVEAAARERFVPPETGPDEPSAQAPGVRRADTTKQP